MSKGGFMKDALILFAITLVAGACLGGVYEITKAPIEAANLAAKEDAFRAVLADADSFALDDYSAALEKANAEETWHYHSSDSKDWNNVLYDIYKTANNTEKQIAQAKKLLLMGNEKFWDVLKQIYKEHGAWNENYESLLDELKNSLSLIHI